MGEVFFFLLVAGIVASWVFAAIRGQKWGGTKGVTLFLINLFFAIVVVSLLWLIIVYPSFGCSGFLCGLEEIISWLLLSAIMMIVWPLILIAIFKRKWPDHMSTHKQNDELLDDEL